MSAIPLTAAQPIHLPSPVTEAASLHLWQSADVIAARGRLELACRYRNQHNRLDNEFANLRASQAWLAVQSDEEAARLLVAYVDALGHYLRQRGLNAELVRWCQDGLRACERLQQNHAWLLLLRSEAQSALGLWDQAAADMQAVITVSREEDPATHARAVLAFGRLQLQRGDYKKALETLAVAETLLSRQSDYEGLAAARMELAAYHLNRRELDRALTLYLEVDQLRRRAGASETSDHTLLMLGVVYRKKGDYERAAVYLRQLLERGEARHTKSALATAAHHLAWVRLNQGDVVQARLLCGRAMAVYEELGDARGTSDAYEQLGLIYLAEANVEEALSYLEQSLRIRRQLGNQHGAASSLSRLAIARFRMGQWLTAARDLWQSLAIYWRLAVLSRQRLTAVGQEIFYWVVRRQGWTM